MMTIHKINLKDSLVHNLPMGAIAIHAGYQGEDLCLWLMLNTNYRKMDHAYLVSGTGWNLPDFVKAEDHIASVVNPANNNIWHIFDLGYVEALKPFEQNLMRAAQEARDAFGNEAVVVDGSEDGS